MRIAVDYESVSERPTGIGIFTKNLVETMRLDHPDLELLLYQPKHKNLNPLRRILWESSEVPARARHDKADLIYSPGFACAVCCSIPRVVTAHDLIGKIFPDNQGPVSRFYWSLWLPNAISRAERILAISEATRADIRKYLHVSESRLYLAPHAGREDFEPVRDLGLVRQKIEKYGIRGPYLLSVGSLEPRKNHLRLLHAFNLIKNRYPEISLVIAGKDAGSEKEVRSVIAVLGLTDRVHILGYVAEEDLIYLYNGARAYVMISLYEGFGYPVLEAMRCGVACIVSNVSSLPEVVANAALQVSPYNIEEMAKVMEKIITQPELAADLSKKGLERSKYFSMKKTAAFVAETFREMISKKL